MPQHILIQHNMLSFSTVSNIFLHCWNKENVSYAVYILLNSSIYTLRNNQYIVIKNFSWILYYIIELKQMDGQVQKIIS